MAAARDRLASARAAQEAGFAATALSAASYAMLYAARAALSEEDRNAKTHRGVWVRFSETFVAPGRFDRELAAQARRIQRERDRQRVLVLGEEAIRIDEPLAARANASATTATCDGRLSGRRANAPSAPKTRYETAAQIA